MSNVLKNPRVPWGSTPNTLLYSTKISLKAKGLYAFMESKPNDWNFTSSSMASQLKESRKSILSAMQELKDSGWLAYQKNRDGSGVYELLGRFVAVDHNTQPKSQNDTQAIESHSPVSARCQNGTVSKGDCISKKDIPSKKDLDSKTENTKAFDSFWEVYPRKERKADARKMWKKMKLDSLVDLIISDVKIRKTKHKSWVDGFVLGPVKYLSNETWEEEILTDVGKTYSPDKQPSSKLITMEDLA